MTEYEGLFLLPATEAQSDEILALYRSQIGQGTSDWNEYYPDMACIQDDLADHALYTVQQDGRIIAAISLHNHDDELDALDCWTPARARSISRLCVDLSLQGQGIAGRIVEAAIAASRTEGYTSMRLLCSKTNAAANRLYQRLGFVLRGSCTMYETNFFCYEKMFNVT